jgi:hypothetical protein
MKAVYSIVNNSNCVKHMRDMYLTIEIKQNTVVDLTCNFNPKGASTALNKDNVMKTRSSSSVKI